MKREEGASQIISIYNEGEAQHNFDLILMQDA